MARAFSSCGSKFYLGILANLVVRSSPFAISLGQRDPNRRRSLLYLQTSGYL